METPAQGIVALLAASVSVAITLGMVILGLRAEKKRPVDNSDDH